MCFRKAGCLWCVTNNADIGLLVGGGFEIIRIAVEVRYNIGMRNISSSGAITETKTRAVEVVAKFRLR